MAIHTPALSSGPTVPYRMRSRRYRRLRSVLERRQPDLTVLMEQVHKPHNLSAILRNCDAAGVLEAHAVPPRGGLEVHHDTSGGTKKWIHVHRHEDVDAAVADLHAQGLTVLAAHPGEGAVDFRTVDFTRPTCLMMGAELHGVSDRGLELADGTVVIPMEGMVRSLNVSVATALLLYEAHRQRTAAGLYQESRLEPDRFRRILFEWCHPELARRCRDLGRSYPALGPEGELLEDPLSGPDRPHGGE